MTHTAVSSEPEILIESEGRRGAAHKDRLPVALIEAKRGKRQTVAHIGQPETAFFPK